MIWKDYSRLKDTHAFLSASRYHWVNYSEEKLMSVYRNSIRTKLGTRYHSVASELIKLAIKLPDTSAAFNMFVNDAIGHKMESERILFYSTNCYGTADAISYNNGTLRIHDLKTGDSPGSITQLMIYAAIFCLDYEERPQEIILRIYQGEEILEYVPEIEEVEAIMDKIIIADKIISVMNEELL